jgi:hypothetical protein
MDPVGLHPPAEERLVDQRRIEEVPGMRMLRIQVADRRQEAAGAQRRTVEQALAFEQRLLDLDAVVGRDRCGQAAREGRIDAGRQPELGFAEREAALARADLATARDESLQAIERGVTRQVGIAAVQDQRDCRIESRRRRLRATGTGGRPRIRNRARGGQRPIRALAGRRAGRRTAERWNRFSTAGCGDAGRRLRVEPLLQRLQAGFEGLDAAFVARLQLIELRADGLQLGVIGGKRRQRNACRGDERHGRKSD